MYGLCHAGASGTLGNTSLWSGIGLVFDLVLWMGLIAGLVLLVVLVIRSARGSVARVANGGGPTAIEVLKAQYARGEITRDQYELKKNDIG